MQKRNNKNKNPKEERKRKRKRIFFFLEKKKGKSKAKGEAGRDKCREEERGKTAIAFVGFCFMWVNHGRWIMVGHHRRDNLRATVK